MNTQEILKWWNGLPLYAHALMISFAMGAVLLTWLRVRSQVRRLEGGQQPAGPMPQLDLWQIALLFSTLLFLKENNATAAALLGWADSSIPYYHANGGALWLGFVGGGYAGHVKIAGWILPLVLRRRAAKAQAMSGGAPWQGDPVSPWTGPGNDFRQWKGYE